MSAIGEFKPLFETVIPVFASKRPSVRLPSRM
jgi:hypothetical protein